VSGAGPSRSRSGYGQALEKTGFNAVKLPEPLFIIINPVIRFLLRSPFHHLWSKSLMLVTITGSKSGRRFTIPVRYVRTGEAIRCFTSPETLWWRNLRGGAEVNLRIAGTDRLYEATVVEDDPDRVREALRHYLGLYPQDAAYHGIKLDRNSSPLAEDLDRASKDAIVVEARPLS
jgi:hypothetical protein